jgi:DNA replicative helicase MCM subunit Mcm2 (Cdc46/Mcm family)
MSSQLGKPSHDIRLEVTLKRRKVRKGTFSCWECKRRKMKCIPDSLTVFPCKSCQRRGSYCVSQEFPEEAWSLEQANVHYTLLQHASLRDSARTSANSGLPSTPSSHSIAQETRGNGCQEKASTIISGVDSVAEHDIATPTSMIEEPSGNLLFYKSSIVSFSTKHPSLPLTVFVSIAT